MLCNNVAIEIWEFCIKRAVHISAAHIPGKENVLADLASREFQDSHKWMLSLKVLICLYLDLTSSFQNMHNCCQILNLTSLIA